MREKPKAGEFYRHFKGNVYQVKMLARDSETRREMVVYQAMYPPFGCWVRSLDAFVSRVDRQKYPNALQEFRFEPVEINRDGSVIKKPKGKTIPTFAGQDAYASPESEGMVSQMGAGKAGENADAIGNGSPAFQMEWGQAGEEVSDGEVLRALKTGQPDRYLGQRMADEEIARRGFLLLLDAKSFQEKRQIFMGMREYLDQRMLSNIAVALDIVLEDGDKEEQYDSILRCLATFEHYEGGGRLR